MGCGTSKVTATTEEDNEKNEKNEKNGGISNDVTIVANSPITSLPTSNIEVHNDADEKLEIQVEESLPGNPIIDKPLLPPIKTSNTNVDTQAILNRPKTGFPQSQLQRQTLPKLEGGSFPPTNTHLPFDAISKSSTLISDSQ